MCAGCYNYRELNELAITSALGIDKTENGYKISVQVINTNKESNGEESSPKFVIYESEDKTLQEALRKLVLECPRRVYGNHIELIMLGEELVKNDLINILDFLFREPEVQKEALVLIAKNAEAIDVLKVLTPLDKLNSKKIESSLISDNVYMGITEKITLEKIIYNVLNKKIEITIPGIEIINLNSEAESSNNIKESEPNTRLKLATTSVFKDNKLLGWLTEEESISFNFINNQLKDSIIRYECDKKKFVVIEIMKTNTSVSVSNNEPKIKIKIKANGIINDVQCHYDLESKKVIKQIEEESNNKIKSLINDSIKSINYNFNSDIYGFRNMFYKKNYKYYNQIKDNWYDDFFKKIEYDIEVDLNLTGQGNTLKVIDDE